MAQAVRHPAKFNDKFIPYFASVLAGCQRVLDPMAGTGKLANIKGYGKFDIYLNDLEAEWLRQSPKGCVLTQSDAEHLPFLNGYFDAICTSPTYANRMADHHEAKDASRRNTYRHSLGRPLTDGNTGSMQWGDAYRYKHERIWRECHRVIRDHGLFVLNVSDHIRKGEVVPVTDWHIGCLEGLGFEVAEHRLIPTPRLRHGANGDKRVEFESVIVFRKAR